MRRRNLLFLVPLATAAAYSGCSSKADSSQPPATEQVLYQSGADRAALSALLAATPVTDPARGAVFDTPDDNTLFEGSKVVTFSWHLPAQALLDFSAPRRDRPAPELPTLMPARAKARLDRFTGPLGELFGGERSALAQSAPMNGVGYYLRFSYPENEKLVEVFTTATSYTPSADAWKTLAVGSWVTAQLVSATFDSDAVAKDGGPFVGASIKFCIDWAM